MGGQLHGLVEEIENCRQEMVRFAADTSLRNKQVLETSIRLDSLINKYFSLTGRK
ncbi:aspartyl-phosphate phosphatase Spo0E family protein [Neobacillus drentensis]|uniref:aspartyl-phosphate phosphatase Spo0E family protein n=1 Tax=Neobacillus drentensis TaxID=220684 RepID=UPI002FFDC9E3